MPRRPQFGEPAENAIRVRVTQSQRHDLEQVAKENRCNMATVIREAVNVYVSDYREGSLVFRGPK